MARYRKVDPRVWDDERFVEFDDAKRNLFLLLITGPAVDAVPGLQTGGAASLAETLRRPLNSVAKKLDELVKEGMVELDEHFRLIRLRNGPKYNEPDNPNQVVGWFRSWQSLPESPLKYRHIESIQQACEAADRRKEKEGNTFIRRFNETFGTVTGTVTQTVPPTVGGSCARAHCVPAPVPVLREGGVGGEITQRKVSITIPLPDDWRPNEKHYELAASLGFGRESTDAEAEKMRDWSRAKGKRANCADWNARFRNWLRKAAEDRKGGPTKPRLVPAKGPAKQEGWSGMAAVQAEIEERKRRNAER